MIAKHPADICVLIVEDRMAMRKIIKNVLQGMGIKLALEAGDGLEAMSILKQRNNITARKEGQLLGISSRNTQSVDFVICDWSMPNMTGIELLGAIRGDPKLSRLPFVMLTAEGGRDQIVKAIELGVTDYVVKPFTAAVLETKLRAILGLNAKRG